MIRFWSLMPSTGMSVVVSTPTFSPAAFTPAAAMVQNEATPLLTNAIFFSPEGWAAGPAAPSRVCNSTIEAASRALVHRTNRAERTRGDAGAEGSGIDGIGFMGGKPLWNGRSADVAKNPRHARPKSLGRLQSGGIPSGTSFRPTANHRTESVSSKLTTKGKFRPPPSSGTQRSRPV